MMTISEAVFNSLQGKENFLTGYDEKGAYFLFNAMSIRLDSNILTLYMDGVEVSQIPLADIPGASDVVRLTGIEGRCRIVVDKI
jgi:hypothetical protein